MHSNTSVEHTPPAGGFSLLIVLLVGSLMLTVVASMGLITMRSLRTSQAQSDAVRTLYGAEEAFACAQYWLKENKDNFDGNATIACNDIEFNFSAGTDTYSDSHNPSYTTGTTPTQPYANTGIAEFRIPYDVMQPNLGGTIVRVKRDRSAPGYKGVIQVASDSEDPSTGRSAQRFQEYEYGVGPGIAADVMFVLDRSTSINATEWTEVVKALDTATSTLVARIPGVHMGIIEFGSWPYNTAQEVITPACASAGLGGNTAENECVLVPNQQLSDPADLTHGFGTDPIHTGMGMALAVAASELMNKYYPIVPDPSAITYANAFYTGYPTAFPGGLSTRYRLGTFEMQAIDIAVNGAPASNLPISLPDVPVPSRRDREPDATYPDFIILFTDGSPNHPVIKLPTSITSSAYCPTYYAAAGWQPGFSSDDILDMCLTKLTADVIKKQGVIIGTVIVGAKDYRSDFLKNHISTPGLSVDVGSDFADLEAGMVHLIDIFDTVVLTESR